MNTKQSQRHPQQLLRAIAALMIPCYTLFAGTCSYAVVPGFAKIVQILGPNSLGIRRGSQYGPVEANTILRQFPEALYLPGTNRSFAELKFYSDSNQDLGLGMQASTKNKLITLYYFPCTILEGDSLIIEWANQTGGKRACEKGVRVVSGNRQKAQLPDLGITYASSLKQFSRSGQIQYYCSVLAASGQGWIGVKSSNDPCEEPLKQCQANARSKCDAVTLDNWIIRSQDLTALVSCANNQIFTEKGTGETMKDLVSKLWEQAQAQKAKSCNLRVLGSKDVVVEPITDKQALIQTRNTDAGTVVDIITGDATVRSVKNPEGIPLKSGQRYIYSGESVEPKTEEFDTTKESLEVQVFLAPRRNIKLCDQQQVSGGSQGDSRTIQLTGNEGELRISYEMYQIPDRLQVIYEGREIVNTGFVSNSNTISIPFKGYSGQVKVILTGNEDTGTKWIYTLYCPP